MAYEIHANASRFGSPPEGGWVQNPKLAEARFTFIVQLFDRHANSRALRSRPLRVTFPPFVPLTQESVSPTVFAIGSRAFEILCGGDTPPCSD
ncbi:MAG: hypothetical protein QOJ44_245 [Acidimicrobiaceae bacterium]|nr:hypothetical protein [Acidimicrobiaceae bacterium]